MQSRTARLLFEVLQVDFSQDALKALEREEEGEQGRNTKRAPGRLFPTTRASGW